MTEPFDTVAFIMAYEGGTLSSYEEVVDGFQHLIDSGVVWSLQGTYGRMAQALINDGICTPTSRPVCSNLLAEQS